MRSPVARPPFFTARFFRLSLLLLLLALAIVGYVTGRDRTVLEPDVFPFDPSKPYRLRFARGGYPYGMDTVAISASGYTMIHRIARGNPWVREHTALHLTNHQRRAIADAVSLHRLSTLYTEYVDEKIDDGDQWTLALFQAGREKRVSFSNRFTHSIWYFAIDLDDILKWPNPEIPIWAPCRQEIRWQSRSPLCELETKPHLPR